CHGWGQPCDGYYCESCTCPQCGMTLFNGIYDNCIYGAGMPIICTTYGGIEPSYNQNYDDNYYPHESLSFPCCDYCGGSHETFQCQPDNQNVDFSGSDQIQTPQYPNVNPPSLEISNEEIFQDKGDLIKSIQTFLKRFNCIPFEEKPQILFQTWETFFAIQCSQPEDSNELFQKLLEDLKKLAEYDQSTKVPEQQKQKMEVTMFDLVKICQEKEFLCIHDDVNDLIESALDSKLLLINSNSQRLDKKEQEVKNVVEQPVEHGNRKPEHSPSMGYEHLNITPETESDEVTESNAENLLPIPSKCEVTLEDEIECDGNSQQDEIDIITKTDDVLPPSIENFADDPEGDIRFLEELLIDDSILSDELSDANFEENPLIPRPPPKPPDVKTDAGEEIAVVMIDKDKFDDDYQIFMFDKVFSFLSAKSEDTIFDPGISD
nr:hypothetical protein [Tanacetum cinerariifolium]